MWVALAVIGAGIVTASATVYGAKKQSSATKEAARLQKQASDDALRQQTQEMNQQNQRVADSENILEKATAGDQSATMLTGPSGLTLDDLILGRGTSQLGGRQ